MKSIYLVIPYIRHDYQIFGSMRYFVELANELAKNYEVTIITSNSDGFKQSNYGLTWNPARAPGEISSIKILSFPLSQNILLTNILICFSKFCKLVKIAYKNIFRSVILSSNVNKQKSNIAIVNLMYSRAKCHISHLAELYAIGPIMDYEKIVQLAIAESATIIVGHAPFYTPYGISNACKKFKYNYSVITFFHAKELVHYNYYLFQALIEAKKVLCVTPFEQKFWNQNLNIPKKNLPIIYAGTKNISNNQRIVNIKQKKFQILIISRYESNKNYDEVLKLIKKINDTETDINFVIITNQNISQNVNLNNTKVLINTSEVEKNKILRSSDAVIFPSKSESFGLVILEAWKYNLPVYVNHENFATASLLKPQYKEFIYKSINELYDKLVAIKRTKKNHTFYKEIENKYNWKRVVSILKKEVL